MPYRVSRSRVSGSGVFRRLRRRRGQPASFGHWARRLAGRLAAALLLAMVLPVFTVSVSAQAPGTSIGVCMRNNAPDFQSGGQFSPDGDPRSITLIPPNDLVLGAVACAESFAATTLVPIGMRIWGGLALIITVWTGIQMMFGGGLAIGEVVSLLLLLGFPWAILTFYNTAVGTPWGNMTFTTMVTGMGQVVSTELVDGAYDTLLSGVTDTWAEIWDVGNLREGVMAGAPEADEGWWASIGRGISSVNPFRWLAELLRNVITTIQLVLVIVIVVALLIIPVVVAYCSYLWGYLSIMVSVVLGPLLVPWFVIPQLQFLAWGWFRSLLGASIHLMVAGAVFSVVAQILTIPLIRVGQNIADERGSVLSLGIDAGMLAAGGWFRIWWKVSEILLESLPLIVVAYLGVFKIGEITSMIMNGGSMPASGISDRMSGMRNAQSAWRSAPGAMRGAAGMASRGGAAIAGKAAAVATGVGAAAVAAGAVLSQATKRS